jgi:hypothetical protein
MFKLNDDLSIYVTRGDIVFFSLCADDDGEPYKFQSGDVVRIKVYGKKDASTVVLQKDFPVTEECEEVEIFLTEEDTKIGEVISKPKDYWYELELNPFNRPQTIIGYDEDGAKVFKLFPEGDDIADYVPDPDDFRVMDDELDMTSTRPVENQAIARAIVRIKSIAEETAEGLALEKARFDTLISVDDKKLSQDLEYMDYITENTKAKIDAEINSDGVHASIKVNFREANLLYGGTGMDVFVIPTDGRPIDTGLIHTEDGIEYSINFNAAKNRYVLNLTAREDVTVAPSSASIVTFGYALGNHELRDLRVGADGTVYATAGEAVRKQFEAVNAVLAQLLEAIGEDRG